MSNRVNLYQFTLDKPGSDILESVQVAAPDIRKAQATIENSSPEDEVIIDVSRVKKQIPQVSIPEVALTWAVEDGEVRNRS